jgi:hypothetical protein
VPVVLVVLFVLIDSKESIITTVIKQI